MKKIVYLSLLFAPILLTSCGEKAPIVEATKYTVSFDSDGGSIISSFEIEEGKTLSEPSAPVKAGYIFDGWYTSKTYETKVTFPVSINSNITFYAKWVDSKTYFLSARDNTFLKSSSYKYNYTLTVKATYEGVSQSVNGSSSGESSYSKDSTVSFLDKHVNSGALFIDGTKNLFKKENDVFEIGQNEKGEVNSYKRTTDPDFKYDSSSFAKVLFEYKDEDIKAVSEAGANSYEIKTKMNFSSVSSILIKYVDNPVVKALLGVNIPETDSSYHTYVTFNHKNEISSYKYSFELKVKGGTIVLDYGLNVKSVNETFVIEEPSFPGFYFKESEVSSKLTTLTNKINEYKNKAKSSYSFNAKTSLKFNGSNAIDSTTKGQAIRTIDYNKVYFNNEVEFDSDYKNSDVYGQDKNIKDYKRTRGNIKSGEIHEVEDKLVGKDVYTDISSKANVDNNEYFLFPNSDLLKTSNVAGLSEKSKDNFLTYSLVLNNSYVSSLLSFANDSINIDPTYTKEYKVYGDFDASTIVLNESSYNYEFVDDVFSSLTLNLKGEVETTLKGTKFDGKADFEFSIKLSADNKGDSYIVPAQKEDLIK